MSHHVEHTAHYIEHRLEFVSFFACISALLSLLAGQHPEQALAFAALSLPFAMVILLLAALQSQLSILWRLVLQLLWLTPLALFCAKLSATWQQPWVVAVLFILAGAELMWQERYNATPLADEQAYLR